MRLFQRCILFPKCIVVRDWPFDIYGGRDITCEVNLFDSLNQGTLLWRMDNQGKGRFLLVDEIIFPRQN